jgi:hypothetical protein
MEKSKRMWARIVAVHSETLYAETQEGELVFITKHFGRMQQAGMGDIVAFFPREFVSGNELLTHVKWFALSPKFIGKWWVGEPTEQEKIQRQRAVHKRLGSHEEIPYEEAFPKEPVNTHGEVCSTNAGNRE